MAGTCGCGNEHSTSIKGEFFFLLSERQSASDGVCSVAALMCKRVRDGVTYPCTLNLNNWFNSLDILAFRRFLSPLNQFQGSIGLNTSCK